MEKDLSLKMRYEANKTQKNLTKELLFSGIVKFGKFTLKSGEESDIYINLRELGLYPVLLDKVANMIVDYIKRNNLKFDRLAGVAYGSIPLASIVANKLVMPLLYIRKEVKQGYGISNLIEGGFNNGDTVLIVEDVVTSGGSTIDTAKKLRYSGLKVMDSICVVNRQGDGDIGLKSNNISAHSLVTLSDITELKNEVDANRS